MEFNMAITATPTSANTASHMVAIPIAPNAINIALTPKANINILDNDGPGPAGNLIAVATLDVSSS
jgi:hypothetical protein